MCILRQESNSTAILLERMRRREREWGDDGCGGEQRTMVSYRAGTMANACSFVGSMTADPHRQARVVRRTAQCQPQGRIEYQGSLGWGSGVLVSGGRDRS